MSLTEKVKKKSSSERLRGVFYRLFEKNDEGYEDFDLYYESKMDKLINHYKNLI